MSLVSVMEPLSRPGGTSSNEFLESIKAHRFAAPIARQTASMVFLSPALFAKQALELAATPERRPHRPPVAIPMTASSA